MDHTAAFVRRNRLLADVTRLADPDAPVPTCPAWTVRRLVSHVGRGDRWAAEIVQRRDLIDIRSVRDGRAPDEPAAAAWLTASADVLTEAVAAAGSDTPVWTFVGPRPASWWIRRRLHESVVHHADAALAVGAGWTVEPAVAVDSISEWLELLQARHADPTPLDAGATLHLHATDDGIGAMAEGAGEWMVRGDGTSISWEPGHGKGDVAIRGHAAHLLLALLRRIPADDARLQVLGEPELWSSWLERTPF